MRFSTVALCALFFTVPIEAGAQYVVGDYRYTCPVGAMWNDPRCTRESLAGGEAGGSPPMPKPIGYWKTTWGAIAVDSKTGAIGVTAQKPTREAAVEMSLRMCREDGGTDGCRLSIAYHNQCAVIAVPYRNGEPIGGHASVMSAESIPVASEAAIEQCNQVNPSTPTCQVGYSRCTVPELIRY